VTDTSQLRTRIADELNRQQSDIIGSPSLSLGLVIVREINSAVKHHESTRFRWNETKEDEWATTASGERIYALPGKIVKMDTLKVKYSNSYIELRKRTWDYIDTRDRLVTGAQGVPFEYAIYGNVLRVYPTPNGAYTLVGSYMRRTLPTSLTGSYTGIITMGGASLTVTSTASHNNRLNGWTTDGEELIRARALASVQIFYLKDEQAKMEMSLLTQARLPFLSVRERQAFERLADETQDLGASGVVQPYDI
jgi:hypothetical protein